MRSIREYLFDSLSSYVVFEYRNHDGIKLAILFYGSADIPSYILCDGPYASELFLDEGKFVESRHLNTRLKIYKRNPTPSLGVMDYQSIVQGRTSQTRGDVRIYARRFSLVEKGSLAGIEKIASAMFFKDITFPALKRMAYSVINDRPDQVLGTSMTEKALSQFFTNFKAYQAVMKHAQSFIEGTNAHLRINQCKREKRILSIKANLLSRHLHEAIEAINSELAKIQAQFSEVAQNLFSQKTRLTSERSLATTELDACNRLVDKVNREEREFSAKDMAKLRDLVASIPTLENTADSRQEMLRNLRTLSDDIRGKYAQQETLVLTQYGERAQSLYEKRDGIMAKFRAALEQIEHAREAEKALHEAWREAQSDEFNDRLIKAQKALENCKLAHAGLREAAEFSMRREELRATEQTILDEIESLNADARRLTEEISTCKQDFTDHDGKLTTASRTLKEKREQLSRLLSLESPAEGSLLRHLRNSMPGWYENIGKVVRDEILLQTNLSPTNAEENDHSLYGLSLDLDKIEAGLAAREEELAEQISNARAEIEQSRSLVTAIEGQMAKISKQIIALTKEQSVTDSKVRERKAALEQTRAATKANDRAALEELEERRSKFELQIREAQSGVDLLMADLSALQQEAARRTAAIKTQFDRRIEDAKREEQVELDAIKAALEAADTDKKATLRHFSESCEQELREGGVNLDGLRELDEQLRKLKELIEFARAARADVEKYERWLEMAPAERMEAREKADELALQVTGLDEAIQRAEQQAEATNRLLRERQDKNQSKLNSTQEQRRRVDEFRRMHSTEADGYEFAELFNPQGVSLESISTAYARTNVAILEARNERDHKLQPIHSLFARAEAESHIGQASRDLPRIYSDTDQHSSVDEVIDVLKRWYDSGHIQSRDSLNGECRAACQLFETYLKNLNHFQANMLTLSRQLQNSLDTEMVFDAIRRVSIRLFGRVERVPYWSHLNSLVTEFKRWEETDCAGIPPQSLINQLAGLTSQISGGRIEEVPENLIDMEIIVDDGTEKRVSNEAELKNVSSNGLSYLILCMIFVAFVNRVRKDDNFWLTWALDEIGTIDAGNSKALVEMLAHHRIHLVSASPGGQESILAMFKNHYEIMPNFEIQKCAPAVRRKYVG